MFVKGKVANPNGRPYLKGNSGLSLNTRSRNSKLRTSYGISIADYERIYKEQDGKCAICGEQEKIIKHGKIQQLSVDHDHNTGRIRGLLCYRCNTGIGKLMDDPVLLRKAADYLDSKKETGCLIQMVLADS